MATLKRLDKILADSGLGSRQEVGALLRAGAVKVDGEVCRERGRLIDPGQVALSCQGRPVEILPEPLHVLLHKPLGLACSHEPREAPLIYELFPNNWQRAGLQSAGRLDRASSGLLILSTDGSLLHRLSSPKRHLPKRYRLRYSGPLHPDAIVRCAAGLQLPDEPHPCQPAELQLHDSSTATMVLHEGRYHQVRRMLSALGAEVIELHRDRIGDLQLPPDLPAGAFRPATDAEIAAAQGQPSDEK